MGYYGFLIVESIPPIFDFLQGIRFIENESKHEHLFENIGKVCQINYKPGSVI